MSSLGRTAIGFVIIATLAASGPTRDDLNLIRPVDKIVIKKGQRQLLLMNRGHVVKEYKIALGRNPEGHKQCEGDNRTPEGLYTVDWKTDKSQYHMALHVSYPSRADRDSARKQGCSPGGDIMIHGLPRNLGWLGGLHRLVDWTRGCIAVTNAEIEEIFGLVRVGTPIQINP